MTRVLILSTQTKEANTGVRTYCDTLESALMALSDVCVVRLCHMDVSKYILYFSRIWIKIASLLSISLGYVVARWFIAFQTLFLLFKRRRHFDIVVAQDPITGATATMLGFKTLTMCHFSDPIQEILDAHHYGPLTTWLMKCTMLFFLKRNHHYGVLSKTQQIMMMAYVKNAKIELIPTSCRKIDCEKVSHDGFRIAMMGRLEYLKGQERLIDALVFLRDLPISVWFIGDGDARELLNQKSIDLNVADSVQFLGKLNRPEEALAQCDLYIHTSRMEAFSLAPIEAIFSGLPTWSFVTPGYNDFGMFNGTPKLSQETTAEKLASCIREFYAMTTFEQRISVWQQQREIVKQFECSHFQTNFKRILGV